MHLHGSASLPQYDGYADDVTRPGHYKDYWYPNHQGPRTLWYHDHGVHQTAQNVYSGLVAQYHLQNAWEKENLPQGPYDVPLTVSDAMFAKNGWLAYMDRDHSGLFGDVVTVNGVPWPFFPVERRYYRFRVLMATLSRSMNLTFVNTRTNATLPVHVVATDGGLMVPQQITNWRHAGAERYEVMVDFSGCRIGDTVELRNASNKNNVNYLNTGRVMQFRVTSEATDTRWNAVVTPPPSEIHEVMSAPVSAARRVRDIDLEHDDETNEFLINGMTWSTCARTTGTCSRTRAAIRRCPGTTRSGGSRTSRAGGSTRCTSTWSTSGSSAVGEVSAGAGLEKGPKDVVYVGEGEIVEVLVHYAMAPAAYPDGRSTGQAGSSADQGGRYMIHCHNLAHEDHDMMLQFVVAAADGSLDLSPSAPTTRCTQHRPSDGDSRPGDVARPARVAIGRCALVPRGRRRPGRRRTRAGAADHGHGTPACRLGQHGADVAGR